MANKEKGIAKTQPMRVLDEKGIPYHAHQQSHKQRLRPHLALMVKNWSRFLFLC